MYVPPDFEEERMDVLRELILQYPLATLVTKTTDSIVANHIPMQHLAEPAPYGVLRGHIARANTVWRETSADGDCLAIFQGPSAYVSPGYYPTKQETGKVVPTWNYAVVHARGPVRFVHDIDWLRSLVEKQTNHHEREQPVPWEVDDAPPQYTQAMLAAIVGVEIDIKGLIGKWKLSQNRQEKDIHGVLEGLRHNGSAEEARLADMLHERVSKGSPVKS